MAVATARFRVTARVSATSLPVRKAGRGMGSGTLAWSHEEIAELAKHFLPPE